MRKRKFIFPFIIIFLIIGILLVRFNTYEFSYIPPDEKIVNKTLSYNELKKVGTKDEVGKENLMKLGKESFFTESFGNELFFTDVMGLINGPFTIGNISKAIIKLGGKGTSNLRVEAAEDFQAGNVSIKKGDLIDTGLDVARGSYVPIGIKIFLDKGKPKVGVACASCHASVDKNGNVIAGSPNTDFNIGLILAMSTNSAGYFTHTEMRGLEEFIDKGKSFPNVEKLEKYVDSEFVKWPIGSNDTTIDLANNPVQIPDAYTLGDGPYGWSGQGQIGPYNGLSAAINNAHSQNMDAVSQSEISEPVLKIDKDLYIGTLLQNAAAEKYRYVPNNKETASKFFEKVDPNPDAPGITEVVKASTYPRISYLQSVGLMPASSGFRAWEQINSISLYMNSFVPHKTGLKKDEQLYNRGKEIFTKAGCSTCHGGKYFTINKVIKVEDIKTEPSRGSGFRGAELFFTSPRIYDQDTKIPLPKNPKIHDVEMTKEKEESLRISWSQGTSNGGYKTISLYGLYFSAPYLHDAGVSVGEKGELGVANTLLKGISPDPYKSLEAMIDSKIRGKVVTANLSSKTVTTAHISGKGHDYWVDETTGFTKEDQKALIHYLLTLTD
jgi:mono/diheme cytochrome c family protein